MTDKDICSAFCKLKIKKNIAKSKKLDTPPRGINNELLLILIGNINN